MNEPTITPSPKKPLFKSKTAIAGVLTVIAGSIGYGSESFRLLLSNNAEAILVGLGIINIALRLVTKGRVVLFAESDPK